MNISKLMKWSFKLLCVIGIAIVLCGNIVNAQDVTDKNFKSKISKGFVLVKFTASYQMNNLDPKLLDDVKGHEGCVILVVNHEDVKKVAKKLRIRNYPSIALFYNGSKKEVWKADMDGKVDVTTKDIKSAIEDAMAGDVF
jgi:hypothetical protein